METPKGERFKSQWCCELWIQLQVACSNLSKCIFIASIYIFSVENTSSIILSISRIKRMVYLFESFWVCCYRKRFTFCQRNTSSLKLEFFYRQMISAYLLFPPWEWYHHLATIDVITKMIVNAFPRITYPIRSIQRYIQVSIIIPIVHDWRKGLIT